MNQAWMLGLKSRTRWQARLTHFTLSFTLLAFCGGIALAAPNGQAIDVEAIRRAISSRGNASFKVSENWLTRLKREELTRIMGVKDPSLNQDSAFEIPYAGTREATALDWRSKDGVNWVSPMLNQGNCGSCVAFASVATLETQLNISLGIPGLNPAFSTQALFTCGGGACEFGWQPALAAKYLMKTGVPDEACAPYTMGATGETVSCKSICTDAAARSYKIGKYNSPSTGPKNIEAVKAGLRNGPLMTVMMVYEDFVTYAGGIYKHTVGGSVGGHAISIVGYDDATRVWIIRNSWGPEWGEGGFARVSWDDISGISNSTWGFELSPAAGYLSIRNPSHKAFVSGDLPLQADSSFPETSRIEFSVLNGTGKAVWTGGCDSKGDKPQMIGCEVPLQTTQLQDGRYELVASAHWGQGTAKKVATSQHEIFHILNGVPTLSLSFTGQSSLTKPLSGRVVFDIQANSAPVPYSSLEFQVWQGGKLIHSKSADVVVPKMTLGWRTITVPNGNYEVGFVGYIAVPGQKTHSIESAKVSVQVKN